MMLALLLMSAPLATGTPAADPSDPAGVAMLLLGFLRDGRYLPAVGALLILFVFVLRSLLGDSIDWFKTKPGGYVLGFGTALATFLGTALFAGAPITLGLMGNAVAAGFAASGGWEAIRDLVTYVIRKRAQHTP